MRTIELPAARGLCDACLENPEHRFMHVSEHLIGVYCPHHLAGAAMLLHPGQPEWWQILVPIAGDEFVAQMELLAQGGLQDCLN